MGSVKINIDPVTRIEGHLKIETIVEDGVVKEAKSSGMLFRGLELILKGRDPRDAQVITQRICGVCPTPHAIAAVTNLDSAFGIADQVPTNGRIVRNLIQGMCDVQDHILHFYHLAALDYVDVAQVAKYEGSDPVINSIKDFVARGELGPFLPRYEGDYRLPADITQEVVGHYVKALEMRRKGQEAVAIFNGKMPHGCGVVPGGAVELPSVDKIAAFIWMLNELKDFVDNVYLPDVVAVAQAYSDYFGIGAGCKNYMCYGSYDLEDGQADQLKRERFYGHGTTSADLVHQELDPSKISEQVKYSWYADSTSGKHPSQGETKVDYQKEEAYSWLKAPRYDGKVYEVGPLSTILVNYTRGQAQVKDLVDAYLAKLNAGPEVLFSVLGRHLARALHTKLTADNMVNWALGVKPGEPVNIQYEIPDEGTGMGLTEATRGALGHFIEIKDKKIANYHCVVPTTWNASPKDDQGVPGPIEQALIGTPVKDNDNPFELVRIVRSFDPCIACAVHIVSPKGRDLSRFRIT
ncbi:nickel-dependent hydrogenase large subunit [Candidatus Contubernalis alkaliaceticus]|uniref:nickel-dependent hydrogenase large subunit n=1 Tax=Candidatus Contubernalis alkaliaceticus TaxID=338645 RepID=UPI001F4BCE11|nr:nickel-dependent hydrogenase large subunit [Candidatus Contubernalis alkalaceticus]UNC92288.1 nickel-dependent hydrogenase large subunit [Candidatus Contubernalis alkalaceticus]